MRFQRATELLSLILLRSMEKMLGAYTSISTLGFHPTITSRNKAFNPVLHGLNKATRASSHSKNGFRTFKCMASAQEHYQPYRPPLTVQSIPDAARKLEIDEQLAVLRDRIGLWYQYADLIPVLNRSGFTPSSIEEATGMSGVEQNKIVVASRVRSSLVSSGLDENTLAYYDIGGENILYEFRTLSTEQRKSAAEYAMERSMDGKEARDLVRAMKDFERRRKAGWEFFSSKPGDCLAYCFYGQSKEYKVDSQREAALKKALSFAVTEKARAKIQEFLEGTDEKDKEQSAEIFRHLLVVRLEEGEVAEAKTPLVLPVIKANVEEYMQAPSRKALGEGPFRVYQSETAWKSWVVLPCWEPLINAEAPVVLWFSDGNVLPWKVRKADSKESVLVVVDKTRTEIVAEGVFLVASADNSLSIQRGSAISASAGSVLGMAILVVRPPGPEKEEPDMIDWE